MENCGNLFSSGCAKTRRPTRSNARPP